MVRDGQSCLAPKRLRASVIRFHAEEALPGSSWLTKGSRMSAGHGYVCKECGSPSPMGVGYVVGGDAAAVASAGLASCLCGLSIGSRPCATCEGSGKIDVRTKNGTKWERWACNGGCMGSGRVLCEVVA